MLVACLVAYLTRKSFTKLSPRSQSVGERISNHVRPRSSSSASYTAGTSTAESRESTSVTSMSGSSGPNRSPVHKRRSSASSEVSSLHSAEGHKGDRTELDTDGMPIPPVPPLPKNFEAYSRRASSGVSPLVSIDSPRESQSSDRSRLLHHFGRSNTEEQPSPAIKPAKKWSLSAALGIHRSPSFSLEGSPASSTGPVGL